jgi:WD40 repeat protein
MFQYGCVVSCCSDGSVKVWSHKGTEITTLYGHTQRVNNCDMVVKVTKNTEEEGNNVIYYCFIFKEGMEGGKINSCYILMKGGMI